MKLCLVPPRLERYESRATGEAHQVGALDGATGAPPSPCVLTFSPLFVLSFLPPPPLPTLSDQRVDLLFIYMINCINKYTYNSFLILLTVITIVNNFFFFIILSMSVERHVQTCYSFIYSSVSFQPCQCRASHIPILNPVLHSRGVQCSQLP